VGSDVFHEAGRPAGSFGEVNERMSFQVLDSMVTASAMIAQAMWVSLA